MPKPRNVFRAFKFFSDVNMSNVVDSNLFAYMVPRNLVTVDKENRVVLFHTPDVHVSVIDLARQQGANLRWEKQYAAQHK